MIPPGRVLRGINFDGLYLKNGMELGAQTRLSESRQNSEENKGIVRDAAANILILVFSKISFFLVTKGLRELNFADFAIFGQIREN